MKLSLSGLTRALKHKDYQHFITGQIVVVFGFWMQNIASSWLIYRLTGSSLLLGTVSLCAMLPALLFSPFAGIIADKFPKKYILYVTITTFMLASFTQGTLILTGKVQVWHIITNAFIIGTVMAVENPARSAFLMELVGREDLQNAIALNASVFNLGRLAGPAIGGLLLPILGEGWLYIANAIAIAWMVYSVSKISVLGLPIPKVEGTKQPVSEGFVFAYKEKAVRYSLLLIGIGSIFVVPVNVLLPIISVEILNGDSRLLGILMASMGIGAFMAALTFAAQSNNQTLLKWLIVGNLSFALGMTGLAFSANTPLTMLSLAVLGCGTTITMSSVNTLIQLITPNEYRGRVTSIFTMMFMGLGVFGASFAGAGGEYFGVKETIFICAAIMCFTTITLLPAVVRNAKNKLTSE